MGRRDDVWGEVIKSSVNLKGNPKWNPQTAFRALHTNVQIAAWRGVGGGFYTLIYT